jgi:tetratricopeptide (TPR) repeat protein
MMIPYKSLFLKVCFQKKAFVVSLFLLLSFHLFSQNQHFTFDSIQKKVYHEAIQLRSVLAKKSILSIQKQDPDNLATQLSEETIEFYAVIALASIESFEYYKTKNHERIVAFENTTVKSPFVKYGLAEFYLHRAIARVFFNEKFKAVFDLKKARSYILKNVNEYPTFMLNNKPKSLLNILLGSIPPSFKWASGLVSLKGDYNQGISELNRLLNYTYVNPEYDCFFYEVLTYKVLISQHSSSTASEKQQLNSYFSTLTIKNELPQNYLLLYSWSDYLIKNGQNEKAYRVLMSQEKSADYLVFWPIEFLKGVSLQNRLDNGCVIYFNSYIQGIRKGNYVNACCQRLAWQSLIMGNMPGYYSQINNMNMKFQGTEQDQAACFEFQNKLLPQSQLLKARLLFDGGYYDKALIELKKIVPEKISNKLYSLEYYYRLARIYDKQQHYSQAILLYNKVILDGSNMQNYYGANAALNAGNICETNREFNKARLYYQKCLSMDPNQYKESIHQKAKIGLERMK